MNTYQELVEEFHYETGSSIGKTPELRDQTLRAKLIMEEAVETCAALGFDTEATLIGDTPNERYEFFKPANENFVEVIDGLCDLLYVTFGTAVAAGIDLDRYFLEVHESNMDKLRGTRREDGKILKPENWIPPNIARLLEQDMSSRIVINGITWRIHPSTDCGGEHCTFHNPSDHKMKDWPINIRTDRFGNLTERFCEHGIGHPDPDSLAYVESLHRKEDRGYEGIHGCDRCCA